MIAGRSFQFAVQLPAIDTARTERTPWVCLRL